MLVPFRLATPLGELSLFSTLTTFGTPLDVTLDELAIELFFPADDRSDEMLRDLSMAARPLIARHRTFAAPVLDRACGERPLSRYDRSIPRRAEHVTRKP